MWLLSSTVEPLPAVGSRGAGPQRRRGVRAGDGDPGGVAAGRAGPGRDGVRRAARRRAAERRGRGLKFVRMDIWKFRYYIFTLDFI